MGRGRRKYVYPALRKKGGVPVDRAGSPLENNNRESCAGKKYPDRALFYTLREAQGLIEWGRRRYNTVRPHSTLGYRPPAPRYAGPPRSPRSRSRRWR